MKDYEEFKKYMLDIQRKLEESGKPVILKKWARRSPYQARRYKEEFVFPEVWVYRKDGGSGMCITGEDIAAYTELYGKNSCKEALINGLY